jgi:hypothetical protein
VCVLILRTFFETFRALLLGYLGTNQTEKSLQDTFYSVFDVIFCFWSGESKKSNLINYIVHSDMNIITRG